MSGLFKKLQNLSVYDGGTEQTEFDLSGMLAQRLEKRAEAFSSRGIRVIASVSPDVHLKGDTEAIKNVLDELLENALRFSEKEVEINLAKSGDRISLSFANDTELPDGSADQVFDRFTVLENAELGSSGLGLSYVRDIVRAHQGRISAKVANGRFTVSIAL